VFVVVIVIVVVVVVAAAAAAAVSADRAHLFLLTQVVDSVRPSSQISLALMSSSYHSSLELLFGDDVACCYSRHVSLPHFRFDSCTPQSRSRPFFVEPCFSKCVKHCDCFIIVVDSVFLFFAIIIVLIDVSALIDHFSSNAPS